jgi:hypothetical protein
MRFNVPKVDLRRHSGSTSIDNENGEPVGQLLMEKEDGRTIILLRKYQGTFATQAECEAFARGVESVLNYMTANE